MSRREGKRQRSRSNSPPRRGDRHDDRKPHKSSRSDRLRSRSPTPERDRRGHRSSDSRRHSDRRSRSRSPHRSRDSRTSGSDRRSERGERSDRSETSTTRNDDSSRTAAPAPTPEVVSLPVHSIEALLDSVAPAATEELTAKRAAEQAVLEEEIRKRREKVNAWREAKRLQVEAEARANASEIVEPTNTSGAGSGDKLSVRIVGSSAPSEMISDENGVAEESVVDANANHATHGWSLEDDEEEEEVENETEKGDNSSALGQSGSLTALSTLQAPASPVHVSSNDEVAEAAVFKNLVGTPVKSNTHSTHHHVHGFPLAHVTAVSLAAAVTGSASGMNSGANGENSDFGMNIDASSSTTAAGAGAKRRMSRLKQSKWDADSMDIDGDAAAAPATINNNTSISQHNNAAATTGAVSSTAPKSAAVPSMHPIAGSVTATAAAMEKEEEEEVDPLEAFMSSLYDTGDVAVQKSLPSENKPKNGPPAVTTITMEDILRGNVPTFADPDQGASHTDTAENGDKQSNKLARKSRNHSNNNDSELDYTHGASTTPPSPKFAPPIQNYPSSTSLMEKSPSLRTLALNASTSFDNLNRGWESDAGDMFTIGNGGSASNIDNMDIEEDNGEVPWHLMSQSEIHQHQGSTTNANNSSSTNKNTFYTSESETDNETNETFEEREARELREKAEFIEAIRKARAEEDQVRERLLQSDQKALQNKNNNSNSGTSAGAKSSASEPSSTSIAAKNNNTGLGRVFAGEGDMIEEYEIETKRRSALEIMDEARKGKMLREVDHSKVTYIPFRKNLYIVPRALSKLTEAEVSEKREDLQIKVRGKACPVPVDTWEQCGLSDRVLQTVYALNLKEPFAIQKQALPAIMCGRDVIGVAKTGSGKTLAFLLPMLRHILDQPPLLDGEGPIGLIMAPARELASQIFQEAKKFTKPLGLRVACIYGGAGVAEQIADLKRGSEIVVCTPGRMIDILCMQAGKLVSLKRVSMVVMDEADRMFDMGFEPQIKMILQNIRPDRQTVLFSATFPKQIEKLAKTVLRIPLEIVVGERSTVNKDITQVIEVHEEEDKFLRLLQLLGVWYEKGSVLIFVDKQEKCDQLFQDLLKLGYPCLSLHGGKDQVDRDHTLHEFKTGVKTVMVATSVAGRGLDVPDIICVVNYHCPNHIEDYVHRVGRTGRAGRKGTAYTFVSQREDQYAPSMVKVLQKANQPVPQELLDLAASFRAKVARGEATWVSSGFEGKGFTFDASEMNETQKVASMQKKAYERDQGLDTGADADDEDGDDGDETPFSGVNSSSSGSSAAALTASTSAVSVSGGAVTETSPGPVPVQPVFTPDMTPLDRAKALAAAMAANRALGITATGNSGGLTNTPASSSAVSAGPVDPQAALARARLVALQMAAAGKAGAAGSAEEHFSEELDINDYPHQARRKVTNKSSLDDITDRTGVAIISRGAYVPPGKKLEPGERRLHLIIEGTNEMSVRQAKLEIMKVLEDETIRISASGSLATSGRYSVI